MINVEHDDSQKAQITLQLLLSALSQGQQGQPQQAPQQQQPSDPNADLLTQLAPLTAAGANGSAPLRPSTAGGDSGAASYHVGSHRAPSYASYGGGQDEAATGQDKLFNSDLQAQYRAQQADQRLGERAQDQANLREQQDADAMNREQSHDLPQWIGQGLANKTLRYTPAQKKMMQDDQDAHVRVDNDPTLSPDDRARFHAKIAQHDRQNQLNVQRTPADEMPVPPDQAYQSQLIMRPVQIDENTTLNLPVVPYTRNGETRYELSPEGKVQADIARDKIKQQHTERLKQMDLDAKAAAAAAKPPKETPEQRRAREVDTAEMHAQMTNNFKRITDAQVQLEQSHTARVKAQAAFNDASKKAGKPADDSALTAATEAEQHAQQRVQDLEQEHENYKNQAKSLSDQADQSAMDAGQAPDQSMDQPAAQQALPVSSPDDLRQQIRNGQLQSGDTVMTPSGPHQLTDDDISGA